MNAAEDKIRAALHETAEQIPPHSVPPLRLPEPGRRRLPARRPRGRHLPAWLPPLGVAAAVAAVVIGSLTAAHVIGGAAAPPAHHRTTHLPAPARVDGLPPYFIRSVHAADPTGRGKLVIYSSATGRIVAATTLPGQPDSVSAGGGAGTFFAAARVPCPQPARASLPCRGISRTWPGVAAFYRITLAAAGVRVQLLPIRPMTDPVLAISAAPDGRRLAITSIFSSPAPGGLTLTVASAATGRERTWTTTATRRGTLDNPPSWLADSRRLAFSWLPPRSATGPVLHLLDTGVPGAGLFAGAALAPPKRAGYLWDQLVSPDGSTVIGILQRGPGPGIPNGSVVSFRPGTGQPARVLFATRPDGHGKYWRCLPLWISHTGQRVLIRCGYHPAGGGSQHRVFLTGPGRAPRRLPWLEPVPVFSPGSMPES